METSKGDNQPSTSILASAVPSAVILSGGTGWNNLLPCLDSIPQTHILPISDDGGSSAEIARCLACPALGDIRNRLVRVMPGVTQEAKALRELLRYRLPSKGSFDELRAEWDQLRAGTHRLWFGISEEKQQVVREALDHFDHLTLTSTSLFPSFDPTGLSIGNALLSSLLKSTHSIRLAISIFCQLTDIDQAKTNLVPSIEADCTIGIGAVLEDGEVIEGQCEISHPVSSLPVQRARRLSQYASQGNARRQSSSSKSPFGSFGQRSVLASPPLIRNISYTKAADDAEQEEELLPCGIQTIHYLPPHSDPLPSADYIAALESSSLLLYSPCSLYTSLLPSLILATVPEKIAASPTLKWKVLILNTWRDRETGAIRNGEEYIEAIAKALGWSSSEMASEGEAREFNMGSLITHLIYHPDGEFAVDADRIEKRWGIRCIPTNCTVKQAANGSRKSRVKFTYGDLRSALEVIVSQPR